MITNRIGIFGGTFDPIHFGHLRAGEEVRELLELEKIVFIPACIQPLKETGKIASAKHRLDMVKLAISDNPHFVVDDCEIKRGGSSYTVDTLDYYRKNNPSADIYLIVGADSWSSITLWREYRRLFDMANVVVMNRPGFDAEPPEKILPLEIERRLSYDGKRYMGENGRTVVFTSITMLDISGTIIRKKSMGKKTVKYLVPPSVEKYIAEHNLYR